METIDDYRRECDSLIEGGIRRIAELEAEVVKKDATFMRAIKAFEVDFFALSDCAFQSLQDIDRALRIEVEGAEADLSARRREIKDSHRIRVDELFEQRRDSEENEYLPDLMESLKKFGLDELELRESLRSSFHSAKWELVAKANALETHAEALKSTQAIDEHKLEYSVAVLNERIGAAKVQQRKTKVEMVKWHALRNSLREEYNSAHERSADTNRKLTGEIHRLQKNYEVFQKKLFEIEKINSAKFSRIWRSDQQEIIRLGNLLKERIRGVYKTVLAMEWFDPEESGELACLETRTVPGRSSYVQSVTSTGKTRYSHSKIRQVMDLLDSHMGFLVPESGGNSISPIERVKSILDYLAIETGSDMDALISMFFEGQDDDDEELYVDPVDIVEILQRFVSEQEERRILEIASGKRRPKEGSSAQTKKTRDRIAKQEHHMWSKFAAPVSKNEIRTLEGMIPSLEAILGQLQRRKQLLDRRDYLRDEIWKLHAVNT